MSIKSILNLSKEAWNLKTATCWVFFFFGFCLPLKYEEFSSKNLFWCSLSAATKVSRLFPELSKHSPSYEIFFTTDSPIREWIRWCLHKHRGSLKLSHEKLERSMMMMKKKKPVCFSQIIALSLRFSSAVTHLSSSCVCLSCSSQPSKRTWKTHVTTHAIRRHYFHLFFLHTRAFELSRYFHIQFCRMFA